MNEKKHICKYCGKEFEKGQQLGGHVVLCEKNPKKTENCNRIKKGLSKYGPTPHKLFCEYCGKEYEVMCTDNDILKGRYNKTCSKECSHKLSASKTNRTEVNAKISGSLIKYYYELNPDLIKIKTCEYCGKQYTLRDNHSECYCSDECMNAGRRIKLSKSAKLHSFGGYNEEYAYSYKSSKKGWYKGIHCGSSWELAFVMYHIDHNSNIKRCELVLPYACEGKELKYYPDFEIDGQIYEIKGYRDKRAILKEQQYPDIIVIDKANIKPFLKYAETTYGKNFTDLLTDKNGNPITNNG